MTACVNATGRSTIPLFEIGPEPEKPNEFMAFMMDHVFSPVEEIGWVVEKIVMHPQEWEMLRKNCKPDHLDLETVPELLKIGLIGTLFGAPLHLDISVPKGHMEVTYGDLKLKNWVCLVTKQISGAICENPDCLVTYVHEL